MNALAVEPILDARYVLLEAIGRGGMGIVYRAFDRETERTVAIKVLHGASERGNFGKLRPGPASPLADEFAAWARLRHPNIVRAHALGFAARGPLAAGTPYLVLEHVAGAPVHRALAPGREDPARIEAIACQILGALAYVHDTGWVHRDLKPGNVLARSTGRRGHCAKLTDFGLAASAGSSREPGRVSGSLPYVSPEAILGGRIDGRSDLYSLGILLFFLICGRLPCETRDADAVVRWHVQGPPADPRALQPDCPDRLARLVARLTARDPGARPVDARHALEALCGTTRNATARIRSTVCDAARAKRSGKRGTKPRARCGPPAVMRRGEIAALRLAFDATRVGAWRAIELHADRAESDALAAEACVLAQVHGSTLLRLGRPRAKDGRCLGRLVLRLLLAQGAGARELARRHGLESCFPLGFFGGLPVWDRMREERGLADREHGAIDDTSRGIAAFVAEAIGPGPTVLVVAREALRHPLTRAVVERLRVAAHKRSAPRPAGGGLLLVAPPLLVDNVTSAAAAAGAGRAACRAAATCRKSS